MKKTRTGSRTLTALVALFVAAGCSKETQDSQSANAGSEKRPASLQAADAQSTSASSEKSPVEAAQKMSKELPEQLAYLKPVLQKLASFKPESLGDDNPKAAALVEAAAKERVRGLSGMEAKQTLRNDLKLLEKWLANPELDESPAHFVLGYLQGTIGE